MYRLQVYGIGNVNGNKARFYVGVERLVPVHDVRTDLYLLERAGSTRNSLVGPKNQRSELVGSGQFLKLKNWDKQTEAFWDSNRQHQ